MVYILPTSKIPDRFLAFVKSYPSSLIVQYLSRRLFPYSSRLQADVGYLANTIFDIQCANGIKRDLPHISGIIGLSHNIFLTGRRAQKLDKKFFCDVPIAHSAYLNRTLAEEYRKLSMRFAAISKRQVDMENSAHCISDAIVVPSTFVRDTLSENGVRSDKIYVIPYGSSQFSVNKTRAVDPFQQSEAGPSSVFRVLFVGSLSVRKGIHNLLAAFNQFNHPSKELVLAGPVSDESKKILSRYDLKNVKVMGICSKSTLETLYKTSSVLALPSLAEGLALVIGESLSYGLPVIYTNSTGGSELVEDGKNGILIKAGCPSSIVEAFTRLCDDRFLLDNMKQSAFSKSKALCGWSQYGQKWISLINQICKY